MKKRMSLYTWMIVGNFIFPFMNVLFPYLYWRQNRQTEDTAFTKEACNLLNFQILFSFIIPPSSVLTSLQSSYKA